MSVRQISAAELEREIVRGEDIVILDVRGPVDVEQWRIDPERAGFLSMQASDVAADPEAAARALRRDGRDVRVLCNRGVTSLRAAEVLDAHGLEVTSVEGGMIAWARLLVAERVDIGTETTVVQLRREARGCLSYLVASGDEALVVDPAPDVDTYVGEAAALGVRITHVLDTHVHADHLSGARELAERVGAALHVSPRALARGVADPASFTALDDGDRIAVGSAAIDVLALPGHTTDNVGVVVDGRALIAGDSLFADAIARPDLEVGDAGMLAAARVLHATLSDRILPLGDDLVLLPCHYPGGRRSSAIAPRLGAVRAAVPLLSEPDPDVFARQLVASMPPRPANYLNIIAVNLGAETGPDHASLEVGANNCAAG